MSRYNYLNVTEQFNLNAIGSILNKAFIVGVFQVGSSLERPNYRDVDLRCIMYDKDFEAMFFDMGKLNDLRLKLLNAAMSEWASTRTGLPIDFQFQSITEANEKYGGLPRNAPFLEAMHT